MEDLIKNIQTLAVVVSPLVSIIFILSAILVKKLQKDVAELLLRPNTEYIKRLEQEISELKDALEKKASKSYVDILEGHSRVDDGKLEDKIKHAEELLEKIPDVYATRDKAREVDHKLNMMQTELHNQDRDLIRAMNTEIDRTKADMSERIKLVMDLIREHNRGDG